MNQQHGAGHGWDRPQTDHSFQPGAQSYGHHQGAHNQPVQPYNDQPGPYGPPQGYGPQGGPQPYGQTGYAPHGYGQAGVNAYGAPGGGAASSKRVSKPVAGWIMLVGAVLAIVGCFLPWAEVLHLTITGMSNADGESADGIIILPLAALVAVGGLVVAFGGGKRWVSVVALVLAALVAVVALIDLVDLSDAVAQVGALASLGAGLPVVLAGGVIAMVGAVVGLVARRPA